MNICILVICSPELTFHHQNIDCSILCSVRFHNYASTKRCAFHISVHSIHSRRHHTFASDMYDMYFAVASSSTRASTAVFCSEHRAEAHAKCSNIRRSICIIYAHISLHGVTTTTTQLQRRRDDVQHKATACMSARAYAIVRHSMMA